MSLRGVSLTGNPLQVTVTSLPSVGALYQLSQVFSDYGYLPRAGTQITSAGTLVTGSGGRVVYVPPAGAAKSPGRWTSFTYSVSDAGVPSAADGLVSIVGADNVLVASDFSTGADGWTVSGNGAGGVGITHERSSRGSLNYYVFSTEDEVNVGAPGVAASDDQTLWYFEAPAKFRGRHPSAYGGRLSFDLAAASGDFSSAARLNAAGQGALAVLECATCALNTGVRLVRRMGAPLVFNGRPSSLSLTLLETSGWLKDPQSSIAAWAAPTQAEMIAVLSGISRLAILGDHTNWYESVGLDNVLLVAGPAGSLPIA